MGFLIVGHIAKGNFWSPRADPFPIHGTDFPLGSTARDQVEQEIERWNVEAPHIPPPRKDVAS